MKKNLYLLAVALLCAGVTAFALDDTPIPGDFYDGSARKDQVDAIDVRLTAAELLAAPITRETASVGAKVVLKEGTDNGAHAVTIGAPASLAANRTITVPDADVTLADIAANKIKADAAQGLQRVATCTETTQTVTLRGDAAIVVKTGSGAALTEAALVRVWIAATDKGAPSATDNTVAVTTGTTVQAITANAHYLVLSDATGNIALTVTVAGSGDRYVMTEIGGRVTSTKLTIASI
ncbi:MAG: hypothetical protein ABFD89_15975 [Bryobacteraceae bacterium]